MELTDLIEDLERRRAEAARIGATAPVSKLYGRILEELRQVDGTPNGGRFVGTGEAAEILGVSRKTVRRWCNPNDPRLPGARKTSGEDGVWRIPLKEVYREVGVDPGPSTSTPKLWEPDE